jgi:hypothetical protein
MSSCERTSSHRRQGGVLVIRRSVFGDADEGVIHGHVRHGEGACGIGGPWLLRSGAPVEIRQVGVQNDFVPELHGIYEACVRGGCGEHLREMGANNASMILLVI